jgi:hypothetical protein
MNRNAFEQAPGRLRVVLAHNGLLSARASGPRMHLPAGLLASFGQRL